MMLAVLIPTLTERAKLLARLMKELDHQRKGKDVIVIHHEDQGQKTTGQKRNELIQAAVEQGAEYISFFDDDDLPGKNYVKLSMECIEGGFDCCELWGQIYWSGKPGKPFHHSIVYKEWWEDENFYYRCVNHLNTIKLALVKDIKFPEKNFGEDGVWSYAVRDAKVLKTEYRIKEEIIYHYYAGSK